MNHRITIHPLTALDVDGANLVFETAIRGAFQNEGLDTLHDEFWDEVNDKKRLLQVVLQQSHNHDEAMFVLLAKREDTVVGTISFAPCSEIIRKGTNQELADIGELGTLYILPELQGQGIGSALIQALIGELQRRGLEKFCLDSGYKNAQQRWKRKFGTPHTVLQDHWGEGTDHMIWLCDVKDFAAT